MTDDLRGRGTAWLVFALAAAAAFGNAYVYDSIGPVADLLQRQLGFADTQIGMLNAIYSLPRGSAPRSGSCGSCRTPASQEPTWWRDGSTTRPAQAPLILPATSR